MSTADTLAPLSSSSSTISMFLILVALIRGDSPSCDKKQNLTSVQHHQSTNRCSPPGPGGLTLVQVSVSGLHCRMSLTMVAFPFSTAQYRAVLLSCKQKCDITKKNLHTTKDPEPFHNSHLSSNVDVSIFVQQSSDDLHMTPSHCSDQHCVAAL